MTLRGRAARRLQGTRRGVGSCLAGQYHPRYSHRQHSSSPSRILGKRCLQGLRPLSALADRKEVEETTSVASTSKASEASSRVGDVNDYIREGGSERRWLLKQANKSGHKRQIRKLGSVLKPLARDGQGKKAVDILVV